MREKKSKLPNVNLSKVRGFPPFFKSKWPSDIFRARFQIFLTDNEMRKMLVPDLFFLSAVAMVTRVMTFPMAPKTMQMK